jgi:Rrf2 family protein
VFSQTAEYALRAVVCLASNPDQSMTTQDIAKITKVPSGYLSKVLQSLARGNIVKSQRGLHGGFVLTEEPGEISVLQVVQTVDPIKHIEKCPLNLESHSHQLCPLHRRLEESIQKIESDFAQVSLADLLDDPSNEKPLCEMDTHSGKK